MVPNYRRRSEVISHLHLQNFQCFADAKIKLEPITVFCGKNGVGKSALLRGLRWLCLNEWDGRADQMSRWGHTDCRVSAVVENHKISRARGTEANLYTLDRAEFSAFRTKIPELIEAVLKVSPYNFQSQMDLPFWMLLSAGAAGAELNEIFQLDLIDRSLSDVGSEVRSARAAEKALREEVRELEDESERLAWTEEMEHDLGQLEALDVQLRTVETEVEQCEGRLREREALVRQITSLEKTLQSGLEAVRVAERLCQTSATIARLERRLEMEDELWRKERELEAKQKMLNKALKVCPMCGRADRR
jgi:chromosome segregation ATPase